MQQESLDRVGRRGPVGGPCAAVLLSLALGACSREQPAPPAPAAAPPGAGGTDIGAGPTSGPDADVSASAESPFELELRRGRAALELADLAEAASRFEAALALDPTSDLARGQLGVVRLREGRTAPGLQLLRQACAGLSPESPERQSLLHAIVDAGLWEEAEVLTVELLRTTPDDPLLRFVRGRAMAGLKRYPEAAREFARVAELSPSHESAPVNEARVHLAVGDERRAAEVLRAAHTRMPESRLLMQRLAWLLATAHDDEVADGALARTLALKVLALAPKSPEYLTLAAAAFAADGDFTAAVLHEELALEFLAEMPAEVAPPRRDELAAAMRERLAAYQGERRWREQPRVVGEVK